MAWSDSDQNPTTAPSTGYAAGLRYDPLSSATTGISVGASSVAPTPGMSGSYSRDLSTGRAQPFETRETSRALATSADRTAAARRYTSSVSTNRGGTMQAQGERALDLLHPQAVQRFALAAREAHAEGIPVGIYSAYRPPSMGVGGFRDKYKSTHAYGLGFDVSGIGRPGSTTSRRWNEIATKYGLINPYGPDNRKEWNHYQLVPQKSAYQIPGLRDTITGEGPTDPEAMWLASGIDPEGVPYASDISGSAGRTVMAGGTVPSPRQNPRDQPRMGAQGARETATAYAPTPERMEAPFDAVIAGSQDRRPRPAAPRMRPQRDTLATPAGEGYVIREGDSLSRIARNYGVSVGDLVRANGIRNPDLIRVGDRLVIPGQTARPQATVPQPRMRPSRDVAMPTPRPRPERGANVPTPRMRPVVVPPSGTIDDPTSLPWRERLGQPGPVRPRTRMETAEMNYRRPEFSLVAGGNLGTPETQMSIDRTMRGGTPVRRGTPAGPGMDTSGLIREPSADELALRRQPMRAPTGVQPMDPRVAAQVARTPAIITEIAPPTYIAPNGARVWALR